MRKDILEYIIYNLPIWSEDGLSLEQIVAEFNIPTLEDQLRFEPTQEQLADKIINYILKEGKK